MQPSVTETTGAMSQRKPEQEPACILLNVIKCLPSLTYLQFIFTDWACHITRQWPLIRWQPQLQIQTWTVRTAESFYVINFLWVLCVVFLYIYSCGLSIVLLNFFFIYIYFFFQLPIRGVMEQFGGTSQPTQSCGPGSSHETSACSWQTRKRIRFIRNAIYCHWTIM